MIDSLLCGLYQSRVKWTKMRRFLSIPKGQRVIDIGGGDGPFPRADVICEKFLGDDAERTSPLGYAGSRALVVGDIEDLPFADKSFDFVYCSHILEHTSDPSRAIAEITRIGKRGYIEVPSEYLEYAATSRPGHVWTIRQDADGTLVFREKPAAKPNPEVDRIFDEKLWGKDALYMAFHWKNYYSIFNIGVSWEGTIPHRVERLPQRSAIEKGRVDDVESIRRTLEAADAQQKTGARAAIKRYVTDHYTDTGIRSRVLSFVACPDCKGALTENGGEQLVCAHCKTTYPYIRGVPVLLKEHARPQR
jgi:uncharacterized protein YbaR (Trm112 family)/SAM-dependent methyltransferase